MCTEQDIFKRVLIIMSNISFLVEPCDLLIILFKPKLNQCVFLRKSEICIDILCLTMTFFFSSIYHACDNAYGEIPCYNFCLIDWLSLYILDLIASSQAMLTTLLHCLPPQHRWLRFPFFIINPFMVIMIRNSTPKKSGIWIWTIICLAVILSIRIRTQWVELKTFPYYWLIACMIFCTSGILFQKTHIAHGPYHEIHSYWHICMGISVFCGCRLFRAFGSQEINVKITDNVNSDYNTLITE